jgi:PPOX class probable F420-dependent enzyme
VPSGTCGSFAELPPPLQEVVSDSRRAVLATLDDRGRPHTVPVCFAIVEGEVASAVDRKPKSSSTLARIRNVRANADATVLFDRWSEDWQQLAWVMVRGNARVEPAGWGANDLVDRYPQYREAPPDGDVIVVRPNNIVYWTYGPL